MLNSFHHLSHKPNLESDNFSCPSLRICHILLPQKGLQEGLQPWSVQAPISLHSHSANTLKQSNQKQHQEESRSLNAPEGWCNYWCWPRPYSISSMRLMCSFWSQPIYLPWWWSLLPSSILGFETKHLNEHTRPTWQPCFKMSWYHLRVPQFCGAQ